MSLGTDVSSRVERRGSKTPIPANPASALNQEQSLALRNVENFGWQLAFIREPVFQDPIPVVISPDHQRVAVLEADGQINMHPDIALRS